MKISDILKKRPRGTSFEVFPPKTDEGRDAIIKLAADLSVFDPLYVSVSYGAGGTTREGTFMMLKLPREQTRHPLMSHLTGIGETRESMEWDLRTLQKIGIDNILALRGDQPKNLPDFDATAGDFLHAGDLVAFIREYRTFSIAWVYIRKATASRLISKRTWNIQSEKSIQARISQLPKCSLTTDITMSSGSGAQNWALLSRSCPASCRSRTAGR